MSDEKNPAEKSRAGNKSQEFTTLTSPRCYLLLLSASAALAAGAIIVALLKDWMALFPTVYGAWLFGLLGLTGLRVRRVLLGLDDREHPRVGADEARR